MNTELKLAIEDVLNCLSINYRAIEKIERLRTAYMKTESKQTTTNRRIEFLENCLEPSMRKSEAARALVVGMLEFLNRDKLCDNLLWVCSPCV
jgi:hypothetical protein